MPEQRGLYPRMKVADQLSLLRPAPRPAAATAHGRRGPLARRPGPGRPGGLEARDALPRQPAARPARRGAGPRPGAARPRRAVQRPRPARHRRRCRRSSASGPAAGVAVVFSSHQLDLVEDVCEDVVIIDRGRIVAAGAIDELRAASTRRHLEVEVVGNGNHWLDGPAGPDRRGDARRLRPARSSPATSTSPALLAAASAAGRRPPLRLPAADAVGAVHGGRPVMSRAATHLARRPGARWSSAAGAGRSSSRSQLSVALIVGAGIFLPTLIGGALRRQHLGIVGYGSGGPRGRARGAAKAADLTSRSSRPGPARRGEARAPRRVARRRCSSSRPTARPRATSSRAGAIALLQQLVVARASPAARDHPPRARAAATRAATPPSSSRTSG